MTDLRIVKWCPSGPVAVETSHYLPLKIVWVPSEFRGEPLPLHLRMSGIGGGELDLRLDSQSGLLRSLTVISFGPPGSTDAYAFADAEVDAVAAVIDMTDFPATSSVMTLEATLRFIRFPNGVRIDFAPLEDARCVRMSRGVDFFVTSSGLLSAAAANACPDESHFHS